MAENDDTSSKTVLLVSPDGENKVEVPEDDKVYITQLVSGRGYTVQDPKKAPKKGSSNS